MDSQFLSVAETAKALFADLGLTELTVKEGDLELTLKKAAPLPPPPPMAEPLSPIMAAMPAASVTAAPVVPVPSEETTLDGNCSALAACREVKSPLVGVLYLTPAPGASPFVSIGDHVSKGDVLCIVEAMKMMNELTSDYEGTVLDICATNEDLVEYGQVLFKIG